MDHSPAEQLPNGRSVIKLVMGQANDAFLVISHGSLLSFTSCIALLHSRVEILCKTYTTVAYCMIQSCL
jgi:hypothetical protein